MPAVILSALFLCDKQSNINLNGAAYRSVVLMVKWRLKVRFSQTVLRRSEDWKPKQTKRTWQSSRFITIVYNRRLIYAVHRRENRSWGSAGCMLLSSGMAVILIVSFFVRWWMTIGRPAGLCPLFVRALKTSNYVSVGWAKYGPGSQLAGRRILTSLRWLLETYSNGMWMSILRCTAVYTLTIVKPRYFVLYDTQLGLITVVV